MAPYKSNVEREMHSLQASRRADKQVSQRRTALYYGWLVVGASFVIVLLNTGPWRDSPGFPPCHLPSR
jgi:hypothetical protein